MGLMDSTLVTKNLNEKRMLYQGRVISRKEMETAIFGSGIPRNSSMFHQCLEYRVIGTLGPNKYVFGQKPIYMGKVQNAYDRFMQQMKNYKK